VPGHRLIMNMKGDPVASVGLGRQFGAFPAAFVVLTICSSGAIHSQAFTSFRITLISQFGVTINGVIAHAAAILCRPRFAGAGQSASFSCPLLEIVKQCETRWCLSRPSWRPPWRPRHPHMEPSLPWVWPLRAQVGPMRAHTYRLNPAARPFVESK